MNDSTTARTLQHRTGSKRLLLSGALGVALILFLLTATPAAAYCQQCLLFDWPDPETGESMGHDAHCLQTWSGWMGCMHSREGCFLAFPCEVPLYGDGDESLDATAAASASSHADASCTTVDGSTMEPSQRLEHRIHR